MWNFSLKICPPKDKSPWEIYSKLGTGRVSQVRTLTPNFTVMALKCRLTGANIAKINNFWFKFAPKGYVPLSDFYKIWHGWGTPRPAPLCQISPLSLLKCELTAPKIAEIGNLLVWICPKRGISPQAISTKFGVGERLPGPHPLA